MPLRDGREPRSVVCGVHMRPFHLRRALGCLNLCGAGCVVAPVASATDVKVLLAGIRCEPEMSRQREVPRVVVTRPCRPACGHHNSRGCALNQPSRRSQEKSRTSTADPGKRWRDSDMIPEHDPMLRTVARRRSARAAGLWRQQR